MAGSPIFRAAVGIEKRTAVGNLWGASAGLFVAVTAQSSAAPIVVVTATTEDARLFAEDVKFFSKAPDDVVYFPSLEETFAGTSQKTTAFGRRLEVLRMIAEKRSVVVCAGVTSLTTELPSPAMLAESVVELSEGLEIDRDDLAAKFGGAGYLREAMVELPGHFSVRGAIVDVFDPAAASPLRIEFDGDRIESIRSFDPESQLSAARHSKIAVSLLVRKKGDDSSTLSSTILDHLKKGTIVHFRDPDDVERTFARKVEEADLIGAPLPMPSIRPLREFSGADLCRMPVGEAGVGDFAIGAVEARGSDFAGALATLEQLTSAEKSTATIVFANEAERARFWESEKERPNAAVSAARNENRILDVVGVVSRGFRMRDRGLALTSHRELFSIVVASRPATQRAVVKSRAIDDFVDLSPGDFVVHVAHGIAKFVGLEPMEKGGEVQDFLNLEFADGVRVYVPAAKTDLIQKYIGGRGEAPKLSKLGGRSWASKKAEVFRAVADLAAELLETQAVREREEGFAFPADSAWQHEFEAAFPFEETPDQLAAIEAIRTDMEKKRPMDRLLCGDVGFGKTEVAMRAAFKAVQASKQVAVLVPTTVLAEQHTVTFRQRMADFPVRIDGMSRFKTKAEQTKTLIDLAEGKVDIVIGTHRLLSQDVVFKDLGLLVIDEEQRFGVQAKHRLRSLRRFVDVLTLSATPIPRTLHMSILGIRDISSLTQAPAARQPVETKIVNYDRNLIRAAILHELERGGQIFFVHNRVQSIEKIAKELRAVAPEARVEIVHGQMAEGEIESAMHAFVRKEADILLATTIIESGLDIPNANTIFIDRPEMYGLADLHQLRGRVGRYREKAYAYLLLRPDSLPTEESEKRLRAIEEFTELGSGFRIAMRDLEIRGAGNILGHEQHGHISAVGYEMYCRLLDAAVKKLKNEDVVLPDEVTINLNFEASLPKAYIPDMRAKLEMYRKFGRATKDAEFDALTEELRDRFGPPPDAALDFVRICRIRAVMERMRIRSIAVSPGMGLMLRPANMKSTRLRLERTHCRFRVIGGKDVLIVHPMPVEGPQRVLDVLRAALRPDRTKVESLS